MLSLDKPLETEGIEMLLKTPVAENSTILNTNFILLTQGILSVL